MNAHYLRPDSLQQAVTWLQQYPDARLLAGGQSLLAALKLGLSDASHLIDLQDLTELHHIRLEDAGQTLWIGAGVTHAHVARDPLVQSDWAMLAHLAAHVADPQVREVGTMGGSLAHHDPAACWPAAVLASDAQIVTSQRVLRAEAFFTGLFETALRRDEVLLGVRFPRWTQAAYAKFEHPASRFAMPGVAVVWLHSGAVRVALTGMGRGVQRWTAAEAALQHTPDVAALDPVHWPEADTEGDLHASAAYRAHLAKVLTRRVVADLTHTVAPVLRAARPAPTPHRAAPVDAAELQGHCRLAATPVQVWQALLDPAVLAHCLPGCEHLVRQSDEHYSARVRVGLGPVSVRFESQVQLRPVHLPSHNQAGHVVLHVQAQGGRLGQAHARVAMQLHPHADGTDLTWQAWPQLQGQLAQLGQRLMHATADRLSALFFARLQAVLQGERLRPPRRVVWQALMQRLQRLWRTFFH